MLYKFTYKDGAVPKGELVEADSLEEAEKMCRVWAGGRERVKYIGVREAVMLRQEKKSGYVDAKVDVYKTRQ